MKIIRTETSIQIEGNTYSVRGELRAIGCEFVRADFPMPAYWRILDPTEAQEQAIEELVQPAKKNASEARSSAARATREKLASSKPMTIRRALEEFRKGALYETYTMDYTGIVQHAHNGSRWFCRRKERGIYGVKTSPWENSCGPTGIAIEVIGTARLPKT